MSDTELPSASAKTNEAGLIAKKQAEEDPSFARVMFHLSDDIPDDAVAQYAQYITEAKSLEQAGIHAHERLEFFAERAGIVVEKPSAQVGEGIGQKASTTVEGLLSLFKSTAELALDPVPETLWIVDKLVPGGGSLIQITGAPKGSGKTTFVLAALAAVREGDDFLGGPTISTPIVFLSEQSRGNFEAEYLGPAGLMGDDGFHVLYRWETRHFDWETIVAGAVEKCRREGAKILVIDTFISWAKPRDENDAPVMERLLSLLQDAAAEGFTVIVIHHARKGGGNAIEAGRGSSAFAAAVDVIIHIRRPSGGASSTVREINCEGRYGELYDSLVIELTEAGYVARGSRTDVAQVKAEKAVRETLPTNEGAAISMTDLVEALKPNNVQRTACQRVLDKMTNRGDVRTIGKGKSGDPYRYFLPLDEQIHGNGQAETESAEDSESSKSMSAQTQPLGEELGQTLKNGQNGRTVTSDGQSVEDSDGWNSESKADIEGDDD